LGVVIHQERVGFSKRAQPGFEASRSEKGGIVTRVALYEIRDSGGGLGWQEKHTRVKTGGESGVDWEGTERKMKKF